jgi:K(+)-stimulated pyrophosphate-energized sodium pump
LDLRHAHRDDHRFRVSYFINHAVSQGQVRRAQKMNFESPLTNLVWLTSLVSIALTFLVSALLIPDLGGDSSLWWKLSTIISCGTLAGAVIPELVKIFTSTLRPRAGGDHLARARAALR